MGGGGGGGRVGGGWDLSTFKGAETHDDVYLDANMAMCT